MRQRGFYWVRVKRSYADQTPVVACWVDAREGWHVNGSDVGASDHELEVLSERLMPPEAK